MLLSAESTHAVSLWLSEEKEGALFLSDSLSLLSLGHRGTCASSLLLAFINCLALCHASLIFLCFYLFGTDPVTGHIGVANILQY
jgi:hypothetical protein